MKRRIPLAAFRGRWLDQIFNDHELPYSALKLAYFMAGYCTMTDSAAKYREQGKVFIWPSQRELRKKTHLNIDTIIVGVRHLIDRGHLRRVRRGNQVRGSNKYRLIMREAVGSR
jgi:hypothetical protein